MRKRLIQSSGRNEPTASAAWLDLAQSTAEVTSEDPAHGIECALLDSEDGGWRAAEPGRQTVRVCFDEPQDVQRIQLTFMEQSASRTQEFVLRWSSDGGQSFREIVRQQWNFSPEGATGETEDYRVDLKGLTILELTLDPDMGRGQAYASLESLRLA